MDKIELDPPVGPRPVMSPNRLIFLTAGRGNVIHPPLDVSHCLGMMLNRDLKMQHLHQRLIVNESDVMIKKTTQEVVPWMIQLVPSNETRAEIFTGIEKAISNKIAQSRLEAKPPDPDQEEDVQSKKRKVRHWEC